MAAHRADASRFLDDRGYTGHLVRGQPPYLLLEEGTRNRIINSLYWKEQCFGLNGATLCDRAFDLTYIGGTYNSGMRPTPFICLVFKMLQLDLEDEVIMAYLEHNDSHTKYLRALALFYIRLTSEDSVTVYKRLEPFLEQYNKLRTRGNQGFELTTIDRFVDDLLTKERVCGTTLWRIVPRLQLEDDDKLEERVSPLQYMIDEEEEREETAGGEGDGDEVDVNGNGEPSDKDNGEVSDESGNSKD